MAARIGPLLRLPSGGYRQASASAFASAALFTIGQMMPQAPPSRHLPMMPGSFHGTRTSGRDRMAVHRLEALHHGLVVLYAVLHDRR